MNYFPRGGIAYDYPAFRLCPVLSCPQGPLEWNGVSGVVTACLVCPRYHLHDVLWLIMETGNEYWLLILIH